MFSLNAAQRSNSRGPLAEMAAGRDTLARDEGLTSLTAPRTLFVSRITQRSMCVKIHSKHAPCEAYHDQPVELVRGTYRARQL